MLSRLLQWISRSCLHLAAHRLRAPPSKSFRDNPGSTSPTTVPSVLIISPCTFFCFTGTLCIMPINGCLFAYHGVVFRSDRPTSYC
ncbi:hypothetical protein PAXRUDRAFT_516480 [Paxillus rubicundulus Ve08.2h10]|uniref:Uncharacterized protein n=1 Tax=Paxillus rubicundulus Ve08.2h10 TaxID=930991 RepID=A0A0D0E0L3_9AGAM|nr:hypothetical protein PAXRUDRAFT_516480 [Paxillus rubicundulus Ve08.2h10]